MEAGRPRLLRNPVGILGTALDNPNLGPVALIRSGSKQTALVEGGVIYSGNQIQIIPTKTAKVLKTDTTGCQGGEAIGTLLCCW